MRYSDIVNGLYKKTNQLCIRTCLEPANNVIQGTTTKNYSE